MSAAQGFAAGGLLLAAVTLRALPGIRGRVFLSADRDYHASYIDLLRTTKHRIPRHDPGIVGPGQLTYPYGYHRLLSFLSTRAVRWLDRYSGVCFDLILGLGMSLLLREHASVPLPCALALAACYLLLPGLSLVHYGPRAFSLTPRSFSQFLVGGSVLLLGWDVGGSSLVLGVVATLLLALAVLSSKFALQFVVFVFPLASLLAWDATPLLVLVLALASAPLLSGGYFVRQVGGQIAHLRWYARANQDLIRERRAARSLWRQVLDRDVGGLADTLLNRNVVTSAIVREPIVVFSTVSFAVDRPEVSSLALFGAVTAAAIVPYVVTSIGRARTLGESERYLEFAIPAAWMSFWASTGLDHFAASLGLVLGWSLLLYVLNLWLLFRRGRLATSAQMSERDHLRDYLAQHGPCVVLCLEFMDATLAINRGRGVQACTLHGWTSEREVDEFLTRVFRRFPYVDPDAVGALVAQYDVDYLLARVEDVRHIGDTLGIRYRLAVTDRVFRGETYELYRCARP